MAKKHDPPTTPDHPHDHGQAHGRHDRPEANALPVVIIETPTNVGYVETPFQIDLTLSHDPDGTITKTLIKWGDRSEFTEMGRPEWASHRYQAAGSYTITVACFDEEQQAATGSTTVEIIVPVPFEVEDQQYATASPDGQPVVVALDQPVTVTGGTPPYDPPVYDPDDLPEDNRFPVGVTAVKFYVQDARGQRAWAQAYVSVEDATPVPEDLAITVPADEVITTLGNAAAVEWDPASATGGTPPYVFTYDEGGTPVQSGDPFTVGEHTITATVEDAGDDRDTGTFLITVERLQPIPPGNNDEFYAARVGHPTCVFAYALTSDAEIRKYTRQTRNAYSPYYDEAMHAMRISIPPGTQGGISNQVWLPCYLADAGQLVFIWEEIDGPNWNENGGFTGWKYYQIRRNGDKIWFEIGAGPAADPYALGKSRVRQYARVGPNTIMGNYQVTDDYGTQRYNNDSIRSTETPPANYKSLLGKPTRHMIVATQDPADPTYVVFDYYASDPDHPCVQIHKGLELTCADAAGAAGQGRPRNFDWEINTSTNRPQPGPEACMWARYMTIHRGVPEPLELFQQITGW